MKAQEEEAAFLHRFRANPLPRSSVEPRFQAIVDEQMRKREAAAEVNMAALRSQERPFTFYYRCAPAARRHPRCSPAVLSQRRRWLPATSVCSYNTNPLNI